MSNYNAVTSELLEKLKAVVGERFVVIDPEKLETYKTDEEANPKYHHLPEAVVFPENTEQVAGIMRLANQYTIPVTPRSGGTSLAGGAIPVCGGIVLAFDRMDKILEINEDSLYMVVQAGVQTLDIQKAAQNKGLLYAGDPCSTDSGCKIGGNIATNAGGNKAVRYGTTREQVYAIKMVTAEGDIVDIGARLAKKSTGYALEKLIIGSEGTLGIVTEATLKLQPLPPQTADLLAIFTDIDQALSLPNKIIKKGIKPMSMEFMDNNLIQLCVRNLEIKLPYADEGIYVIITVDGFTEDELDKKIEIVDTVCNTAGAVEMLMADDRIWNARRNMAEATRRESIVFNAEDIVVPVDMIGKLMEKLPELENKYKIRTVTAAHIGDGNIHVNTMKCDTPDEIWDNKINEFHKELYGLVYQLGGRLSGEHGIGSKKIQEMEKFTNPVELKLMRAIKQALDPHDILNPGKIFRLASN